MAVEKFSYDNKITRNFAFATILWGAVGMLVGVIIAFQMFLPSWNLGIRRGQREVSSLGELLRHQRVFILSYSGKQIS